MNDHAISTEAATLRLERVLPGPIERVWEYLTDPAKRGTWFASGDMELKKGGKVELVFDHDQISGEPYSEENLKYKGKHSAGTVVRCEPPRLLAYTFFGESEVTFELTPRGKDVVLVLTHRRVADRNAMVSFASGWAAHLNILEDRLSGRPPRPFWTAHAALVKENQARF
jgi:uncharacterized protein YndB with AHSA1/START domain